MKEYKSLKQGISLIVLVVTIVVMLILVSITILSVKDDNTVSKAKEVVLREDILNFQTELKSYIDDKKFEAVSGGQYYSPKNDPELNYISEYDAIKEIIPSFSKNYDGKFAIDNGELVYTGEDTTIDVTTVLDDLKVKIYGQY